MHQTAAAILAAVARELHHMAALSLDLQDQLSPQMSAGLDFEAVQGLDRLTQTLAGLARYVADVSVGADCPCAISIDAAADQVKLTALAGRLRGEHSSTTQAPAVEIELF